MVKITATREAVDNMWFDTARSIFRSLVALRRKMCREMDVHIGDMGNMGVKIWDDQTPKPTLMFPIMENEKIFSKWTLVLNEVQNLNRLEDLNCIGCYRRGAYSSPQENPPTIVMRVDQKSGADWNCVRDKVLRILDRFRLPMVAVEITAGLCSSESTGAGFNFSFNENYKLELFAMLKQSLGCRENQDGLGTLAGFIELLDLPKPQGGIGLHLHWLVSIPRSLRPTKKVISGEVWLFKPGIFCATRWPLRKEVLEWGESGINPGDTNANHFLPMRSDNNGALAFKIEQIEQMAQEILSFENYHRCRDSSHSHEPFHTPNDANEAEYYRNAHLVRELRTVKEQLEGIIGTKDVEFGSATKSGHTEMGVD